LVGVSSVLVAVLVAVRDASSDLYPPSIALAFAEATKKNQFTFETNQDSS